MPARDRSEERRARFVQAADASRPALGTGER